MTEPRYADPAALRQAIADHLRRLTRERPGSQLADLQRQFAYDRLLARVFGAEPDAWVQFLSDGRQASGIPGRRALLRLAI